MFIWKFKIFYDIQMFWLKSSFSKFWNGRWSNSHGCTIFIEVVAESRCGQDFYFGGAHPERTGGLCTCALKYHPCLLDDSEFYNTYRIKSACDLATCPNGKCIPKKGGVTYGGLAERCSDVQPCAPDLTCSPAGICISCRADECDGYCSPYGCVSFMEEGQRCEMSDPSGMKILCKVTQSSFEMEQCQH